MGAENTNKSDVAFLKMLSKYIGGIETRIDNRENALADYDKTFFSNQKYILHRWQIALERGCAALDQSYLIPVSEEYAKNGST